MRPLSPKRPFADPFRVLAVLFLGFVAALTSCSGPRISRSISAIPQLAPQELFLTERAGLEEEASGRQISIDWNGSSDNDPQRQIDLINIAIHLNNFGIVVNPAAESVANTAIHHALSKKIPVVIARDPVTLEPEPHLSFLLENHDEGARLLVERLCRVIKGDAEIALIGVDASSSSSLARLDATENALRRQCPSLRVVDLASSTYSQGSSQLASERTLREHSSLSAFIALNNRAGLGAAAAVAESRDRRNGVRVLVFDQSLPLLLRLRHGQIDSIVVQNMRLMGQLAVQNIIADRENRIYPMLREIPPILVTAENIDAAATQEALLLNWEAR